MIGICGLHDMGGAISEQRLLAIAGDEPQGVSALLAAERAALQV